MNKDYNSRSEMIFDHNNYGNMFGQSQFKIPEKSPSPQLLELTSSNKSSYFMPNGHQGSGFAQSTPQQQEESQIKQLLNATGSSQISSSSEYFASSNSSPTQLGSGSFGADSSLGIKGSSQFWPLSTESANPVLNNIMESEEIKSFTSPKKEYFQSKQSESLALLEDTIERRIPRCSSPVKNPLNFSLNKSCHFNHQDRLLAKELNSDDSSKNFMKNSFLRGQIPYPKFPDHNSSGVANFPAAPANPTASSFQRNFPANPSHPSFNAPQNHQRSGHVVGESTRRKNATRENTATLKAWLQEHIKNPYPTKGEKIMLAIITKMTLTQVSTWFANARRRLKKENKMTWSPKVNNGTSQSVNSDNDEEDEEDEEFLENDESEGPQNASKRPKIDTAYNSSSRPQEQSDNRPNYYSNSSANNYAPFTSGPGYPNQDGTYNDPMRQSSFLNPFTDSHPAGWPSQPPSSAFPDTFNQTTSSSNYSSFAAAMAAISNLNPYQTDGQAYSQAGYASANHQRQLFHPVGPNNHQNDQFSQYSSTNSSTASNQLTQSFI